MEIIKQTTSDNLNLAIKIATKAHEGQYRWNGEPYILHPLRVMMAVLPQDNSHPTEDHINMAMVAVLHDTVEDTNLTFADLEMFPKYIVDAVKRMTKFKDDDYKKYIEEIKTDEYARQVKIADLYDNMNIISISTQKYQFTPKSSKRLEKYHKSYFYLKHGVEFK